MPIGGGGGGCSAASIRALTAALADDTVRHASGDRSAGGGSGGGAHARTLRGLVDQLSAKHRSLFCTLLDRLGVDERRWPRVVCALLSDILRGPELSWGVVASSFAFVYVARQYLREVGVSVSDEEYSRVVSQHLQNVAALQRFVAANGGWDGLVLTFSLLLDEEQTEKTDRERKRWISSSGAGLALGVAVCALVIYGLIRRYRK